MELRSVADGVWAVTAGAFPSNSYICATAAPGGAILIDAGLDGPAIDRALDELGLAPAHVLCTHGHFDHLGSARYFQQKYGAAVHLHRLDFKTARTNNFLLMAMRLPARIELPDLIAVDDGHRVEIGGRVLTYRHSPGHTPGSCVITLDDNMFTGDTLYSRGVGLSKLPGEVPETLRASIIALWDELPRYTVHPGHGPSAAGSEIRRGNGALRAFLGLSPETAASNHA